MKMKPSIALFAASALLAGVAGAQEKAAEAPAADQPKQEKEITVSPEQMKRTWAIFWVSRAVSNLVPFLP